MSLYISLSLSLSHCSGIPSQILPLLMEDDRLVRSLTQKGRLAQLIAAIPVYVVVKDVEVGLRGVELLALREVVKLMDMGAAEVSAEVSLLPSLQARLAKASDPFGGLQVLPEGPSCCL